jgi:hypothetical protein
MEETTVDVQNKFKDLGCYVVNVGELLTEIGDKFVEENNKIVISWPDGYRDLIQTLINKIDETLQECEGKELVFEVPQGIVGEIIKMVIKTLGFDVKFR